MQNAFSAKAYSATSETSPLASDGILRRNPTERDLQIEILFCGICHSDLHQVRNEWRDAMPTVYPCVPGHEIVGRVSQVGSAVTKYKSGDLVAVGCLVDSDHTCPNCQEGLEQFCPNMVLTYNSPDKHLGGVTMAAIPIASWSMSASFYASRRILILRAPRHCCALASPPTLPCATGASPRARRLAWSASAG